MGRPKGSKNKSKQPKIDEIKAVTVPVSKVKQAEIEEEEEETPDLGEALKDLGNETIKKPVRGIKQRKMAEQIEWIFTELKNLRNYIRRIEDERLKLPEYKSTIPDTDVVIKHKRRKSTITPTEVKEKEEVNETE